MMMQPEICFGKVFHQRVKPVNHQFSYGVFFLRIPLSTLNNIGNRWLSLNRFNLLSVMSNDYGPRDGSDLQSWARKILADFACDQAKGEIVLQTFPRVLGYVFNPISIWYCYDKAGGLRAAICEVNNTFHQRHNYFIAHDDQRVIAPGDWLTAQKRFYVSPFCEVKGHYRFRFEQTDERAFAQVDYYDDDDSKLLVTTIHGKPEIISSKNSFAAFFSYPLMTVGVIFRIHWQALRLWLKRVRYVSKPTLPSIETTR